MTQVCEELVHALKALVSADGPMELERQWRQAAKLLGEDSQGMRALVDALAEKSIRVYELERLATEDAMTGLANRRSFADALRRELARRRRAGGPAVLLLDLDCLKEINDRFGHAAGDEAIRLAAVACLEQVRAGDLVARLGGDETKYKGRLSLSEVTHDLWSDDADPVPAKLSFADEKKAGASGAANIKKHCLGSRGAVDPNKLGETLADDLVAALKAKFLPAFAAL